jgi:pilus assembly protein CpaD
MKKSNMSFKRFTLVPLLFLATSALSGCVTNELVTGTPMPYSGSESHPISVATGPVTLEVASKHGTMQPIQINAVASFAHQAMSAGLTPVTISRPSGGGASARVANEIASLIVQQGISRQMIRVKTYAGPSSAPVNISFVTTHAQTEPCTEWSEDITQTSTNAHMPTHGCAVQTNIAAMIVDPQTLVVPTTPTAIPADSRVKALTALSSSATASTASTPTTP